MTSGRMTRRHPEPDGSHAGPAAVPRPRQAPHLRDRPRPMSDAEFDALVASAGGLGALPRRARGGGRRRCAPAQRHAREPRRHHRRAGRHLRGAWRPHRRVPDHAARRRRPAAQPGIAVMMGAPNLLRGGSHSGNVAAVHWPRRGCSTSCRRTMPRRACSSARFASARRWAILAAGFAAVTAAPAGRRGLTDRGRIAPGLRADLLRFRLVEGLPVPRGVWVGGTRVA